MSHEEYSVELICEESDMVFDNLFINSNSNENHMWDQDKLLKIDKVNMNVWLKEPWQKETGQRETRQKETG